MINVFFISFKLRDIWLHGVTFRWIHAGADGVLYRKYKSCFRIIKEFSSITYFLRCLLWFILLLHKIWSFEQYYVSVWSLKVLFKPNATHVSFFFIPISRPDYKQINAFAYIGLCILLSFAHTIVHMLPTS